MAKDHKIKPPHHYRVGAKNREYFTANLAQLIGAAVPLQDTLSSLQESSKSRNLQKAIAQMRLDIDDGTPLWKTLQRSGIVSNQTLALVQFGEQSGNLPENLHIAARQEEKQRILRGKMGSALTYPMFVLSITAVVGIGVAWFLLPRLAETFSGLDIELPLISRIFINIGTFLGNNGWWFVPLLLGVSFVIAFIVFISPKTRSIGQRLLLKTPGVAPLIHQIETSRFGYLMSTLLNAGLPVTQALVLMQQSTESPPYKKFYAFLANAFDNGDSFKTSFGKLKKSQEMLPAPVQQMVIAGEKSGNLSETLMDISRIYEEKADTATQNLEAILEPILLIIVWLGVLGVAVAVILPVYSLVSGLQT